jgi:hypothetical protein
MPERDPSEQPGDRGLEILLLLAGFVALVGAGVWLLGSMADLRQAQDCAAQGRRNCATIERPELDR